MAQLKDLIVNGPSRFIGDVYATTFTGDLNGNANTATSATNASTIAGLSVHSGRNNEANKIVRTDGTGYLQVGYINSSDGHEKNASSPTYVWGSNSSDSYLRSYQTSSLSVKYATTSGSCSGNAATATKATQDSDGNVIRDNYIRKDGNNGTAAGVSALINKLSAGSSDPTDADYYICQYAGGGTTTTTYHRRPMSSMWNWIKAKTDTLYPTKSGSGATGTWGISISGNAATATNATDASYATRAGYASSLTAERFDSDDPTPSSKNGLTFQFSYNLGSGASGWWNVLNMRSYSDINYTSSQIITPANNPGTDTGYSGDMKWRQGRNSTWLDWKTLLDSNNYTTYCTPANIGAAPSSHTHTKSQITDFAHTHTRSDITDFAHNHDDRYYTESEVNNLLANKSNTNHTHSYIVTQGDNRSTATKPSDYNNRITFAGLKTNDTVGNPSSTTYNYVVGLRGWSNTSGGKAHELAFNDNGIFHRIGATDTWESWDQLETKGNTAGYLNKISKSGNTLTITPKGSTAFTFTNTTYSRKWDDNLSNTDYPGYGDAVAGATDASFSLVSVGDMKRWNKASYMLEGLETLLASI